MTEIRRKLYKRGSSFETTLPKPLAFALDESKNYKAVFVFDTLTQRWYIDFEEIENKENAAD